MVQDEGEAEQCLNLDHEEAVSQGRTDPGALNEDEDDCGQVEQGVHLDPEG